MSKSCLIISGGEYAPFEKPQVAVAVVLEHGMLGQYSMQVAKDLLDAYFKG